MINVKKIFKKKMFSNSIKKIVFQLPLPQRFFCDTSFRGSVFQN